MNDELRRMLDQQEQLRRLADPLAGLNDAIRGSCASASASASASLYEAFRMHEEEERRRLIEMATGSHSLGVAPYCLNALTEESVGEMFRRKELEDRRTLTSQVLCRDVFDEIAKSVMHTGLESIGDVWRKRELEERQELIDQAIGRISGLRPEYLYDSSLAVVASDRSSWDGIGPIENEHVLSAMRDLVADKATHAFGSVGLQALAAVALEESAGLSAARREASSIYATSVLEAGLSQSHKLRMAEQREISALALQTIQTDRLAAYAFGDTAGLASLTERMEAMRTPWLREADAIRSATSFAHLQALGDLVQNAPPYASAVSAWLRTGMGDWRDTISYPPPVMTAEARIEFYVDHGFDSDIATTDTTVLVRSAAVASLYESDDDFAEDWIGADADELAMAQLAYARLLRFELALRYFIAKVMSEFFNEKWMRNRLPSGMLDAWVGRRDAGRDKDQRQDLIAFADFTDYLKIIERGDNWREVFASIFGRKEDIKESLQRLYPLRLATAHARPAMVTSADLVCLWSETKRVITAFKRWEQERGITRH